MFFFQRWHAQADTKPWADTVVMCTSSRLKWHGRRRPRVRRALATIYASLTAITHIVQVCRRFTTQIISSSVVCTSQRLAVFASPGFVQSANNFRNGGERLFVRYYTGRMSSFGSAVLLLTANLASGYTGGCIASGMPVSYQCVISLCIKACNLSQQSTTNTACTYF